MKRFPCLLIIPLLLTVLVASACAQDTPAYHAPEWTKHAIWYQIFPERFRNGDDSNNPTAERIGAPDDWHVSPWTGDWYQRAAWEQRVGPQFRDFVLMRRYGGDLQGVIDELDYLEELGINAIYFNPVFDAVSLHKYDASTYHHIDRYFGPDPEGDARIMEQEQPDNPSTWQWTSADRLFLKLLREAHRRHIRVIIDGVFNHTGQDFWAFRDLRKNQQDSPYKGWYDVTSFDNPATPDTSEFDFHGWWGFKGLPEFREENGNLVNPVREYVFDITRRWMDPNGDGDPSDGIDGWRLDVATEVGHGFWKEWHALVRKINPQAYTTAEIWTPDASDYVNGGEFTAVMNYRFTYPVADFMIDREITATEFGQQLAAVRKAYPAEANYAMQNLMDSHDTPRLASMIVNPGRKYDRKGKPSEGFSVRKPNAAERKVQKLIALFQYTYVGAPMIYYGDEAGMWGADDPDDRKPMVWPDMNYDAEINHPFSKDRPRDANNFDRDLFDWYKKLAHMRSSLEALQTGSFTQLLASDGQGVYVFLRRSEEGADAIVVVNRSEKEQKVELNLPDDMRSKVWKGYISGSRYEAGEDGTMTLQVKPVFGMVLTN